MYNTNNNKINLTKVDSLIVQLDERIKSIPDIEDKEQRVYAAGQARDLLFRIYNFRYGLDVKEYCSGTGKPTCIAEQQAGACC
jgi:hypothetical protein